MMELQPISPEYDVAVANLIRTNLKAHQLDIPGTVYFDDLEMLGVDQKTIMEDYLKTNHFLAADLQNMIEMVESQMGITGSKLEKTLRYMFAVQEEYLEAVYLKTEEIYGGFPEFLSKGLGCDRQTVEHLRKLYLQP